MLHAQQHFVDWLKEFLFFILIKFAHTLQCRRGCELEQQCNNFLWAVEVKLLYTLQRLAKL